jgi:hypothetical protein
MTMIVHERRKEGANGMLLTPLHNVTSTHDLDPNVPRPG